MVAKALSQQQQERFDSLEGTFNKEVSYLHRVISFASLVAIGLACLGLFIWVQTKFSSNAEPLKQTTLENREICDELAVRVARMERMESLGLMAGSVAHDFNNIMVGVLGNAEVIQMVNNSNQNDFVRERMSGIIRSATMSAAAQNVFKAIRNEGTQASVVNQMQTREDLYSVLDYHKYEQQVDRLLNKQDNTNSN